MVINRYDSATAAFAVGSTVSFVSIAAFVILLALNLEAMYNDQPMLPWIVVAIPMIFFETSALCLCIAISYNCYDFNDIQPEE